jgi:hypothetical protein
MGRHVCPNQNINNELLAGAPSPSQHPPMRNLISPGSLPGSKLGRLGLPMLAFRRRGRDLWFASFGIIIPYEPSPESSHIWCDGWHLAAIEFRTTLFPNQASAVHSRKNRAAFSQVGIAMIRNVHAASHLFTVSPDRKRV